MTGAAPPVNLCYARKLYAFLRAANLSHGDIAAYHLSCLLNPLSELENWWNSDLGQQIRAIADSSDRVNLHPANLQDTSVAICHPISGEAGHVNPLPKKLSKDSIPQEICQEPDAKKVFWWFWRFYPEKWLNPQSEILSDGLLYPAHRVLPDCPLHSYQATVSALAGSMLSEAETPDPENARPYLLIFTFSPIQDFIKASRKFLDFWAGSYLLHYLSAHLCWHIADTYGPDTLIVPSLWGQDIIDARLLEHYREADSSFYEVLKQSFKAIADRKTPVQRFVDKDSNSLSTAGFPNVITVLVPGLEAAKELGKDLSDELRKEWVKIGTQVQQHIRGRVSQEAADILGDERKWDEFWAEVRDGLPEGESSEPYKNDLKKWRSQSNQHGQPTYPNWEWCPLWEHQLTHTWEPYWATVPLGDPGKPVAIAKQDGQFDADWKKTQATLSKAWQQIPSAAEEHAFDTLNVGTWWGSFQQRLRIAIQSVKNTRVWNIPVAPGERSTISGQYSAVHPNLNYRVVQRRGKIQDFREGGGLPEGTMRLFWLLMAKAYPGLFNGSERLNALELTKRMAWIYGNVADSLGIDVSQVVTRIQRHRTLIDRAERSWEVQHLDRFIYDRFVRFPNLSSIAAARFIQRDSKVVRSYCDDLEHQIGTELGSKYRRIFQRIARIRPGHIPKTDKCVNPDHRKREYLNGVMFSAKWLAEDLGLDLEQAQDLRGIVEDVHRNHGFKEGSPSDWWAIVLADGDGMGQYISGSKLEDYEKYIDQTVIDKRLPGLNELNATQKRMGPATHIGLNRALLDFSNRLVPYLTEKRFCGKVIYSGGDDVMAVLPLEDVPGYLRSLRAAWSGAEDPEGEFDHGDGYWRPKSDAELECLPQRPLFTMGKTATLSMGVVIAHKSVPLPTVLEKLWEAEGDRAKEMVGKDGICFRVIYSGGNTLEALMKGHLLDRWWQIAQHYDDRLGPMLHRLAEELPKRADINHPALFGLAAQVLLRRRDEARQMEEVEQPLIDWLNSWGHWAQAAAHSDPNKPGSQPEDLGYLLRFTAFWADKMVQRQSWRHSSEQPASAESIAARR